MSIINFEDINKEDGSVSAEQVVENIEPAPLMGSMKWLILVQKCQAEASYTEHLKVADMFSTLNGIVEDVTKREGITEQLIATPELVQMLGRYLKDILVMFSEAYGNTITILTSDRGKKPYYSVTMKIEDQEPVFPQPMSVTPIINLYRITRGRCEVLKSTGWKKAAWRDYVGLTREQWADVKKDRVLNKIMYAIYTSIKEPSNSLWKEIKKENEPLYQLCDADPLVYQLVSIDTFGHNEKNPDLPGLPGLPRLLLVPECRERKGVAIGASDGKLVLYLKGHSLYPVAEFEDVFEAAGFVKTHYNKYESDRTALTLPLSKEKVIHIEDIRSISVYDFDAIVNGSFPARSFTEKEKESIHAARLTLVDIFTDSELDDELITAYLNRRRAKLFDKVFDELFN